jgi:hypothetical protein
MYKFHKHKKVLAHCPHHVFCVFHKGFPQYTAIITLNRINQLDLIIATRHVLLEVGIGLQILFRCVRD